MGKIIILDETTKNPITKMGIRAGICTKANIQDPKANYERGLECLEIPHGRVEEFPNIEIVLSGYSARAVREYYTHIGCLPSRLQESTRYVNMEDFEYVVPESVANNEEALNLFVSHMRNTRMTYSELEKLGIPKEDCAMILPLGMETVFVDKRNLRNFIDMMHQRSCGRAYWEMQEIMRDIKNALRAYSTEWAYIVDHYFIPKCAVLGYCPEKRQCKRGKGHIKTKAEYKEIVAKAMSSLDVNELRVASEEDLLGDNT